MTETRRVLPAIAFCHDCTWRDPDGDHAGDAGRNHAGLTGHKVSVVTSTETVLSPDMAEAVT